MSMSEFLSTRGYSVLRFDYYGQGDSDGEFSESSIGTMIDDTRAVLRYSVQKLSFGQVILFGFRLGGNIALAVEQIPELSSYIIFDPVTNFKKYAAQLLRLNILTQMRIYGKPLKTTNVLLDELINGQCLNVEGYDISHLMYKQIESFDIERSKPSGKNILLISSNPEDKVDNELDKYKSDLGLLGCEIHSGFVSVAKFWNEINAYVYDSSFMHGVLDKHFASLGS